MSSPVEAVLFDIDGTLCEYRRSGAELLALAFDQQGVEPFFEAEDYYARYDEFTEATDSVDEHRQQCFAAIAKDYGRDPALGRAVAETYSKERDHRAIRALPGALEAVAALAEEHRIGVVTNGAPAMQAQKLAGLELDDAFETIVHAGYDTLAKPDPEPFYRALDALDARPANTVHVGNSLSADVPGAQAAGLRAAWLSDGSDPDPVPDYTLDSMADLREPPWRTR